MKFCYECAKITAGKPLFCNFCGRSYDVKLCPRLHVNPRKAEACSRCGNRNLSIPQPRRPILCPIVAAAILVITALFLTGASFGIALEFQASSFGSLPASLQLQVVLIVLLWAAWAIVLPHALRIAIYRLLKLRRNRNGS